MTNITEEIRKFVNQQKLAYVATVCPDGTPNLSPKGTIMAWDDKHLVFANIHSPGTVENLRSNNSIEINMVDIFTRKGYRFKGTAEILSDGDQYQKIVATYGDSAKKYNIKEIIVINVVTVIPVWSPAYDDGTTEEVIMNRWIEYWDEIHSKTKS
jgi:predicted pyridoxine 5'-phosphate oxidase superfamily flavin-nucleotide-binding protein